MSKLTSKKQRRAMKYKMNKSSERTPFSRKLEEITLNGSKLKFCPEQLQNLNFIFRRMVEDHLESLDQRLIHAKSVAERFIQGLLCGVGILDKRFTSKYLISLESQENFEITYLYRIDSLSTPRLYQEDNLPEYFIIEDDDLHPSYAKIKLDQSMLKDWGEFTNLNGFLRRDKLQSKVVELLAKAASKTDLISIADIDESILCGSPGKVITPYILNKILYVPTQKHVYYGSNINFPNPKDFRIAIVDEPEGIRIHLEFLSPALTQITLDIRLLIAINVDYWSSMTDFPFRISLGHTDCLLYHLASQTGMFLVGFGVHSSAWQIRFPAAEEIMINHYSQESTVRTILMVTSLIFTELKDRFYKNTQNKILNYYLLRTALFYELENDKFHPTNSIIQWSPLYLSTLVLKILDKLIQSIQKEFFPNYFFPKANLIANPGHLSEEDYFIESHKIKNYITKLFDDSLCLKLVDNEDYAKMIGSIKTEMILLSKWKEVVDKMSPPKSTRARRMSLSFTGNCSEAIFTQYTQRQMEYIGLLLKNVLAVKENIWKNEQERIGHKKLSEDPLEDIIYLLITILEEAKNTYIKKSTDTKIKEKVKLNFHVSTNKLIQLVRKDTEINSETTSDDIQIVKIILKWLYKLMDQSKKYFAPILRPYLSLLFNTSHAVSWHIEEMKVSKLDEFESLGIFAELINQVKISPAYGIVDAYSKKWIWAKSMLELLEKGKLKLIFIPKRNEMSKHTVTISKKDIFKSKNEDIKRYTSFSTRNYFDGLLHKDYSTLNPPNQPMHDILKHKNPINLTLKKTHRNGDHRCAGDIFKTLFSMHRANILHDITKILPQEDGYELLKYIKGLKFERDKKRIDRVWSLTLPNPQKGLLPPDNKFREKYTSLEEDSKIRVRKENKRECFKDGKVGNDDLKIKAFGGLDGEGSLLGSCRAARLRDTKSMFYIEESFRFNK